MALSDIVNVSINKSTAYPSRAGFGTPALVVLHTFWQALVRRFSASTALTEMATAGVPTSHVLYRMASRLLSQSPRVKSFVVIKRTRAYQQIWELRPQIATEGFVYSFTLIGPTGTETAISYTVLAAATTSTVATAIAALINAAADVSAAAVGPVITATVDSGDFMTIKDLPPISVLEVLDVSTDPGADDDLSDAEIEIQKSRSLSFYAAAFDHLGGAALESAASWFAARKLLLAARTSDSECAAPGVTDCVLSNLQAEEHERTTVLFAQGSTGDFRDVAWLGKMLPTEPGAATWAYKTLTGISADSITSGEEEAILSKGGNTYLEVNDISHASPGVTSSGEYVDVTRDLDFVHARLQEDLFGYIASQQKVPFTQSGIDALEATAQARLDRCTRAPNQIFSSDNPPVATATAIGDTEASDRASRVLREISFAAQLTGAIHTLDVSGTVTV